MTLIEQIGKDFTTAFKAREMDKKNFLGLLKSEVTKESKTPDDVYIVSKIKSMIKNAAATNSLSEDELAVLETYLPKQMSEAELGLAIGLYIKHEGLSTMKDMGKVMGYLKTNHDGQYDGKLASGIIKELLN